jgi:hypothetical protein
VLGYHWTRHPTRLREARALGAERWQDQDAAVRHLLGTDRAGLIAAVLGPPRQRGWLERFLSWCVVGDAPSQLPAIYLAKTGMPLRPLGSSGPVPGMKSRRGWP